MKARLWELQKQKCIDAFRSPEFGGGAAAEMQTVSASPIVRARHLDGGTEEEEEASL